MTRDAFADRLLDLAYGELPPREAREVEAHAAACAACAGELARIRGTRRVMGTLPEEPAPERGEGILLAAAREAAERRRPRRLAPRWLVGGLAAAASVAVVATVSYRVFELRPRRDDRTALLGEPGRVDPPRAAADAARAPPAPAEGLQGYASPPPEPAVPPAGAAAPVPPSRRAAPPSRGGPSAPPAGSGAIRSAPPPAAPTPGPTRSAPPGDDLALRAERGELALEAPAASAEAARVAAAPAPRGATAPEARLRARGKSAAAPEARQAAPGEVADSAEDAAPARVEVRRFPGCAGEALRVVEVDAGGRVVRYVREGRIAGRRLRIDHAFGPDGRLARATVVDLDAPGAALDPEALGLELPATAAEAGLDAPPRCGD